MEYLTHLYKDNVKLYVSYYIFLVATVLVAYNIEFTQIVTYGWVACGIAVSIPLLYSYIFGDLGWLDFFVLAAAPVVLLIVFNLTVGVLIY
jgi:hypothetical protein